MLAKELMNLYLTQLYPILYYNFHDVVPWEYIRGNDESMIEEYDE